MMRFRNLQERIAFLRENPIFWSLFGHESASGNWDAHEINAKRHKALDKLAAVCVELFG